MAQLVILGHKTRSKEVIEILEMLGGKNTHNYACNVPGYAYIINEQGIIGLYIPHPNSPFAIFTLEEFFEKFPYKVGDKVMIPEYESEVRICKMHWDGYKVQYMVYRCDEEEHYSADELNDYNEPSYKEQETIDKSNKAVFDVNAQCCDISNKRIKKETMEKEISGAIINRFICLEGYDFYDDKGNIIDTKEITMKKKQPKYPKTYDECCSVLNIPNDERYIDVDVPLDFNKLLYAFTELLICRNAYWKIAGEQMGLGKPWKPDFTDTKEMYYIFYKGYIEKGNQRHPDNHILIFPTPEMRDAFLENFKDLIELCKELL